jgi:hypothetical protein
VSVKRSSVVVTVAALIACCLPGNALAAGEWLPAQKITEADRAHPLVGMFGDGESVMAWSTGYLTAAPPEALTHLAGTPFGPAQPLSTGAGKDHMLAVNEAGAAAVLWHVTSYEGHAWIALRAPGGAFGEPHEIRNMIDQLGIDRDGNAYVLVRRSENGVTTLESVLVLADGSPPTTRLVYRGSQQISPGMGVDAAGTVTVAWGASRDGEDEADSRIYVTSAAPGAAFGEALPISEVIRGGNSGTRVLANRRGDVLVLWTRVKPSTLGFEKTIAGVSRPAGGSFGPEDTVPLPDPRSNGNFSWDAAIGDDGEAVVAWSNLRNVSMAFRPPGGPFEPAHVATPFPVCCEEPPIAQLQPAVAFDGMGNAAVAYRGTHRVEVVRRPHLSTEWLAPQSAGESLDNIQPDIAFDRNGRGIVLWAAQAEWETDDSKTDHGIYAAEYDPNAPPRVTRIVVRSKPRLAIEATDQGRAKLVVRRKSIGGARAVVVKRPKVVPGYNAVTLTRAERRRLGKRGRYVAVARITDRAGHTSSAVTTRFRAR